MTCEHCGKRPAAFLVTHAETSEHWRCLRCFRSLVRHAPVVVTGAALPSKSVSHTCKIVELSRVATLAAGLVGAGE